MATSPNVEPAGKTQLKPGWKTTEFWVTVLTQFSIVGGALAGVLPPKEAALLAAFSQAAYTIARGIAKSGEKPAT